MQESKYVGNTYIIVVNFRWCDTIMMVVTWCKWLIKRKIRFQAAPPWSCNRLTRHLTQTNSHCYANMVNPFWPATSCIHTKHFATKTVVVLLPQLKGCETHLKKTLIFHQFDPFERPTIFWGWLINATKRIYFTEILHFIEHIIGLSHGKSTFDKS